MFEYIVKLYSKGNGNVIYCIFCIVKCFIQFEWVSFWNEKKKYRKPLDSLWNVYFQFLSVFKILDLSRFGICETKLSDLNRNKSITGGNALFLMFICKQKWFCKVKKKIYELQNQLYQKLCIRDLKCVWKEFSSQIATRL